MQGPDCGVDRSSPYLFPSEVAKLLACGTIPLRRRKKYALSLYTGLRPGELAAITFADVHLDAGYIHVHRTLTHDGLAKPTKTRDTRRVPLEGALHALFATLNGEGEEPVVVMPHRSELAGLFRADLKTATIGREELTADDERAARSILRPPPQVRDAPCDRGDDPLKIQPAMGYDDLKTTQRS